MPASGPVWTGPLYGQPGYTVNRDPKKGERKVKWRYHCRETREYISRSLLFPRLVPPGIAYSTVLLVKYEHFSITSLHTRLLHILVRHRRIYIRVIAH